MPVTPRLGSRYPAPSDPNDVPLDLQRLAEDIENVAPGVSVFTTVGRDALTAAKLWNGRVIYNSTAQRIEQYSTVTSTWSSVITAHGALTGLGDDDHPQYLNLARHDTTARHGATVVDHGLIGGLGDDDHTQYLNVARHDVTARHGATVVDHGLIGGLADDDHAQYLNTARHDVTARHGAAVVDHGSIGGLADDDHTQYHTDARGDVRYFRLRGGTVTSDTDTFVPLSVVGNSTARTVTNKSLTANVATLTTSVAHGFTAGRTVVVAGVDATFNGTYTILDAPSTTTFRYNKTAADVLSAAATGTATADTQTANLQEWKDNGGVVRSALDPLGRALGALSVPAAHNTQDVGTATVRWRDLYLSRRAYLTAYRETRLSHGALAAAATLTLNPEVATFHYADASAGAITVAFAAGMTDGDSITLRLFMSTVQAVTWPAGVLWMDGAVPTLEAGENIISFWQDGNSKFGARAGRFAA